MYRFLLSLLAAAVFFGFTAAATAGTLQVTTKITGEDMKAHPIGTKIAEYNERLRELGNTAKQFPPGSDAYIALKKRFDELKQERDEAGKDLRGLNGKAVVLHGPDAARSEAAAKRTVIQHHINNPNARGGAVHVHYDKSGKMVVSSTPPRPQDVKGYQEPQPALQQPAESQQRPIVAPPLVAPPDDGLRVPRLGGDCITLLGQLPDPTCRRN